MFFSNRLVFVGRMRCCKEQASKDLTCLQLEPGHSGNQHISEEHIITYELIYVALLPLFLKSILHLTKILIVLLKVHASDFVQRRKLIHK